MVRIFRKFFIFLKLLELLGPKTEDDLNPKKEAAKPTIGAAPAKKLIKQHPSNSNTSSEEIQTFIELTNSLNFHKPGKPSILSVYRIH